MQPFTAFDNLFVSFYSLITVLLINTKHLDFLSFLFVPLGYMQVLSKLSTNCEIIKKLIVLYTNSDAWSFRRAIFSTDREEKSVKSSIRICYQQQLV